MSTTPRLACILDQGPRPELFGDRPGQTRILDRPIIEWQTEMFQRHGLEVRRLATWEDLPTEPCYVVTEDLLVAPRVLRRFLQSSSAACVPVRLGIQSGPWTRRTTILQKPQVRRIGGFEVVPYPFWYFPEGRPHVLDSDALEAMPLVMLGLREVEVNPEGLDAFRSEGMDLRQGFTDEVILRVDHWTQVLYANLFFFFTVMVGMVLRQWWRMALRMLTALTINKWKLLGKANVIGPGCDIHPTAVLEGCVLGRNVSVGAHAYLQGCFLGDGAIIEPKARCFWSVVGAGAKVAANAQVLMSVLYPRSLVSILGVQLCVVGEDTKLLAFAQFFDLKYKRPVIVEYGGKKVSLESNNMGVGIGHRTLVMAFTIVDAGICIPNDLVVVADMQDRMLARIPKNLPTGVPLLVRSRTLEPLEGMEPLTAPKVSAPGEPLPGSEGSVTSPALVAVAVTSPTQKDVEPTGTGAVPSEQPHGS